MLPELDFTQNNTTHMLGVWRHEEEISVDLTRAISPRSTRKVGHLRISTPPPCVPRART